MKSSKFWIAVVVTGVALTIVDFLVQGMILSKMYYEKMPDVFNMATKPVWYVLGDFVSVFIFAWVYDRVASNFGGGPKGGMTYGLYAGILINFPTWIFVHLMMKGIPYGLSWIFTIYGIVWYCIAGAIIGAMYKKGTAAAS